MSISTISTFQLPPAQPTQAQHAPVLDPDGDGDVDVAGRPDNDTASSSSHILDIKV